MTLNNIIFIFSLPRSGSTLLQRILMSHSQIDSISEPWILLPLIAPTLNKQLIKESAIYNQKALNNFVLSLPNKESDYFKEINCFVRSLYKKHSQKNIQYFIDKTPRYYYVIPEIAKIFPEAKFIFLFRNPLSVLASIIKTWSNGTLIFHKDIQNDLFNGLKHLDNGYSLLKEKSIKVYYENLISNPNNEIKRICQFLDLKNESNIMINNFYSQKINGFGDPNRNNFTKINSNFSQKWKNTINTKTKQIYAKKYLNHLGKKLINKSGYNFDILSSEIDSLKLNYKNQITEIVVSIIFLLKKIYSKLKNK